MIFPKVSSVKNRMYEGPNWVRLILKTGYGFSKRKYDVVKNIRTLHRQGKCMKLMHCRPQAMKVLKNKLRFGELDLWDSSEEHLLFLQRTRILFPAPTCHDSQSSKTTSWGIQHILLTSMGTTHVCRQNNHTHKT